MINKKTASRKNRIMLNTRIVLSRNSSGQFFSLTVFLIILFLIIFVAAISRTVHNEDQFNINRLQKTMMNNYVSDFDKIYVPQIIGLAAKPAVAGVLKNEESVSKERLVQIMFDGDEDYMDPALAMKNTLTSVLGTTTYSLNYQDGDFSVILDKVDQLTPDELQLTFLVSYHFTVGDDTWERHNKEVIVDMNIRSLRNPLYDYEYIGEDWVVDDESTDCFSNQVFTDAEPCTDVGLNLKPPVS